MRAATTATLALTTALVLACSGLGEPAPLVDTPAVFHEDGLSFSYPSNWQTSVESEQPREPQSFTDPGLHSGPSTHSQVHSTSRAPSARPTSSQSSPMPSLVTSCHPLSW